MTPVRFAVAGVDPGGRDCGIVGRIGNGSDSDVLVLEQDLCPTLRREGTAWVPDAAFLALLVERIGSMLDGLCQWLAANQAVFPPGGIPVLVAVEDLGGPEDYRRGPKREPAGVIGLAATWGAVCAHWPDAIQVPQGFNGGGPRQAYPPELWGAREGPAGQGILRDARSAWDVAGAGIKLARFGGPF